MKMITRDSDYAIRALCCIAGSRSGMATVTALSKELDIPKPFLRKILQILNKKKLLKSFKGKGGGFSLVADPSKLTVCDIVEVFQGPIQLNKHVFKGEVCPHLDTCILKKKLDGIEKRVARELRMITIVSLLKQV